MRASPERGDNGLVQRLQDRLGEHEEVIVAYLFGSRSRGSEGPLSDVDVAVLLGGTGDRQRQILELAASLSEVAGPVRVDLVVLDDAPVALGYRVLRDGRLLVSRDDLARVRNWVATVDRYLDMAPARRMLADGVAHRLAGGTFGRR